MRAVILAGGEGTRLRPLTEKMPKPMIPVAGRPCVEYSIMSLVRGGFRDMVITTGYLSDKLIRNIGHGKDVGARVLYSFESEPAGTAGAVKMICPFLESPFVVLHGDTLTSIDIRAIYDDHVKSKAVVTMAVTEVDDPSEFGVVEIDGDGFIKSFQEKPSREEARSNLINAGIYVINKEIMDAVPEYTKYDFAKQLFPMLLAEGRKMKAHKISGTWLDIGRPADLHKANLAVVEEYGEEGRIDGCTVSGKMIINAAPKVGNDVEFRGPCYIGSNVSCDDRTTIISSCLYDDVQIGHETRISEGLILEKCRIGKNCDIRDSILSPGVRIGDNVHMERSVIGEGVFIKGNSSLIGAHISPQKDN